jgi:hypothetical protein
MKSPFLAYSYCSIAKSEITASWRKVRLCPFLLSAAGLARVRTP